jgi:hypothetical protein
MTFGTFLEFALSTAISFAVSAFADDETGETDEMVVEKTPFTSEELREKYTFDELCKMYTEVELLKMFTLDEMIEMVVEKTPFTSKELLYKHCPLPADLIEIIHRCEAGNPCIECNGKKGREAYPCIVDMCDDCSKYCLACQCDWCAWCPCKCICPVHNMCNRQCYCRYGGGFVSGDSTST